MGSKPNYIRKKYGPMQAKTLQNALSARIAKEFPRIGGPRIRQLCADMILEILSQHMQPREYLTHGSVLWMAVSVDDPPKHRQRIADCNLVPVVLEVITHEDIQMRLDGKTLKERLEHKAIRLCKQAYKQGGLLSNCDIAELLNNNDSLISSLLVKHERETNKLLPRRATLHDVGSGLTHKRIICHKRFVEGKEPHLVAKETYHSLEAVDRYLAQYDRVRYCKLQNMSPRETAHTLDCSVSLVQEYLSIDEELNKTN